MKRYKLNINTYKENVIKDPVTNSLMLLGSAFTLTYTGRHIGFTTGYEITNEEIGEWDINIGNANINLQDKTMYRYPKLDLPRQKVDLLKEKFNVKVIRDKSKADIHVVSQKYLDRILVTTWDNIYEFKHIFNLLKILKEENKLTKTGLDKVRLIIAGLPKDSFIEIKHEYSHYAVQGTKITPDTDWLEFMDERIEELSQINRYRRCVMVQTHNEKEFDEITSHPEVILDTDVINVINSDLAIIESEEYDNVKAMVLSNDKDNRSLALEMLANCNVDKSFDVVSNIYYWHLEYLRDTSNWNTVNVKAFRKRMHKFNGCGESCNITSYNNFIRLIDNEDKLTKFIVDSTRERMYKNIFIGLVGKESSAFHIKIDDVALSDRYIKKTKINE